MCGYVPESREVMAPPFRLALVEDRDGTDEVTVMVISPPLNGSEE